MTASYDDPVEVARAKAMAAGPLGQELVRFPLQFAQPVIIGSVPEKDKETRINNATATLLRIENREFAITCEHVVAKYREERDKREQAFVFQVGMLELDLESRLVDVNKDLDLAVIDITGLPHDKRSVRGGAFQFHEPHVWPPKPAAYGEFVSFAGFPGAMRQPLVDDQIDFDTFAVGAQPVSSSHDDRLAFQFEREYWVSSYGMDKQSFAAFGGMSGAPVMVMRKVHWDIAGFITHFSESWDLLFAAPAIRLREDGTINAG